MVPWCQDMDLLMPMAWLTNRTRKISVLGMTRWSRTSQHTQTSFAGSSGIQSCLMTVLTWKWPGCLDVLALPRHEGETSSCIFLFKQMLILYQTLKFYLYNFAVWELSLVGGRWWRQLIGPMSGVCKYYIGPIVPLFWLPLPPPLPRAYTVCIESLKQSSKSDAVVFCCKKSYLIQEHHRHHWQPPYISQQLTTAS